MIGLFKVTAGGNQVCPGQEISFSKRNSRNLKAQFLVGPHAAIPVQHTGWGNYGHFIFLTKQVLAVRKHMKKEQ